MKPNPTAGGVSVAAVLAVLCLAATPGCVVDPSSLAEPSVDGGAAYRETAGSTGDPIPLAGDWWKAFHDSTLDRLMARLESGNPGLKAALARYDQSRAALGIARADQSPSLVGDGSMIRNRDSAGGIFVPPDLTYNEYRAALNLKYEIDLWGRVRKSVDAARAEMEASAADLAAAELSLKAELARAWFQFQFVNEEIDIVGRSLKLREENRDLVKARVEGGETNELDLERARTELETTRAQLLQLERSRSEWDHAIAALMGEAPANFESPSGGRISKPATIPAGVPSELIARRPDIAAARQRLAAAADRIGVVKRSYLPRVTLTGVGGLSTLDSSQFFDPISFFGEIGPRVDVPLFQGGRSGSDLRKAEAVAHEALAVWRETVVNAFREVENALSGIRFLDREIAAHIKAVAAAESAADLSRTRYEGGLISYLEVVDAERTALNERRELTRARSARHLASVQLVQALGGGWEKP